MTTLEILAAARALIQDPAHWCAWHASTNAEGVEVKATDPTASHWCAVGALFKVANITDVTQFDDPEDDNMWAYRRAWMILEDAAAAEFLKIPAEVNDELGHTSVMLMYDNAIRRVLAQEALIRAPQDEHGDFIEIEGGSYGGNSGNNGNS